MENKGEIILQMTVDLLGPTEPRYQQPGYYRINLALPEYTIWLELTYAMMTSSNGTISALLAFCAGKSPVTGEFHSQRPVARSFDVFFDLHLNKRLGNNREAGDLRRYRAH